MLGWFRSGSNVPEPWSPCDYQLRVRVSERLSFLRIGLGWAEDAARRMPLLQHAMPQVRDGQLLAGANASANISANLIGVPLSTYLELPSKYSLCVDATPNTVIEIEFGSRGPSGLQWERLDNGTLTSDLIELRSRRQWMFSQRVSW